MLGGCSSQHVVIFATAAGLRPARPPAALAVAIDFGTYASGFAYAPIPQHQHQHQPRAAPAGLPPRVQLHTAWPGQPAPDPKTRTAVLYRGRSLEAWGWEAWRRWCDMAPAAREAGGYSYLESFKLLLRERGAAGRDGGYDDGEEQQLDTVCPLPAGLTAVQVAADFLGAMRRYILAHLQRCQPLGPSQPPPHPDLLLWCLTLPAMWGEADKARVREAARRAGLTRTLDSPSLLLTLEPEAAAVPAATAAASASASACADAPPPGQPPPVPAAAPAGPSTHQHTGGMPLLRRLAGGPGPAGSSPYSAAPPSSPCPCLSPGDTLLVVDCGGGTVDVTLHSVLGAGAEQRQQGPGGGPRLADAAVGRGALCGGRFVDEALWRALREGLGPEAWDTWRAVHPADWTRLRDRWELAKRSFSGEGIGDGDGGGAQGGEQGAGIGEGEGGHHDDRGYDDDDACGGVELLLPRSLADFLGEDRVQALQPPATGSPPSSRLWLRPDGCTLVVPGLVVRHVFGPVAARVLQLAAGVAAEGAEGGSPPNKLLLAGGFACSPFLQLAVRRELLPALQRMAGGGAAPGVELLLPQHPEAAVLQGAVLYGVTPSRVVARRCRLSYGVRFNRRWTAEDRRCQAQHGYPRRFTHRATFAPYADDVYLRFVERGQLVGADELVTHSLYPLYTTQTAVSFELFATERTGACYTCEAGMAELGCCVLRLPPRWAECGEVRRQGTSGYPLKVDMLFGAMELTLRATNPRTGEQVDTRVDWAGGGPGAGAGAAAEVAPAAAGNAARRSTPRNAGAGSRRWLGGGGVYANVQRNAVECAAGIAVIAVLLRLAVLFVL